MVFTFINFYSPPSSHTQPSLLPSPSHLQSLSRSLLSFSHPTLLHLKTTFWQWWRQQRTASPSHTSSHHHHILSKALASTKSTQAQIPAASWAWLSTQFTGFTPPFLPTTHDHYLLIPVPLLSSLLSRYDILLSSRPSPSRPTQFSIPPTHTWKCRFAAPRSVVIIGPFAQLMAPSVLPRLLLTKPCVPS